MVLVFHHVIIFFLLSDWLIQILPPFWFCCDVACFCFGSETQLKCTYRRCCQFFKNIVLCLDVLSGGESASMATFFFMTLLLFSRMLVCKRSEVEDLCSICFYFQLNSIILCGYLGYHFNWYNCYINKTRGSRTATPALIKVIETGRINKYFCMQKIFKIGVILWENAVCVQSLTFLAQKALFSAQFFGVKMLDYKGVSSVILYTDKFT